METEKTFGEGIYFTEPRQGAPSFVLGSISINVAKFVPFINAQKNKAGYVNLDLKKSKGGKCYFEVNTYEKASQSPAAQEASQVGVAQADVPTDEINPEDIPF